MVSYRSRRESICGGENPHYSILRVDAESRRLIVGKQNYILQASLRNISEDVKSARLEIDRDTSFDCQNSGHSKFECQNHPQYLIRHPTQDHFLLCGTHAGEPRYLKDWEHKTKEW